MKPIIISTTGHMQPFELLKCLFISLPKLKLYIFIKKLIINSYTDEFMLASNRF